MAKKNNPGCDCCDRILIWDMGQHRVVYNSSGQKTFDNYTHFFYNNRISYFDSAFDGNEQVDYAIVPSLVQPRNPTSLSDYSGRGFWDDYPDFDPDEEQINPPDDFWTRNIFDYKLIVWIYPQSDVDLDTAGELPCLGPHAQLGLSTVVDEADHPKAGGLPSWWEDVAEGTWVGRLLIIAGSNGGDSGTDPTYPTNLFVNTLGNITGMSLDTGISTTFQNATQNTDLVFVNPSDLTDGFTQARRYGDLTEVFDGEPQVRVEDYRVKSTSWCGPSENSSENSFIGFPFVSRNTITIRVDEVDYLKDIVIQAGSLDYDVPSDFPLVFYQNMAESPISNDHSIV